jgi:hypothetical protein
MLLQRLYNSALCYMCQAGCHARTIAADAPVNNIALIKALARYIQHEDRDVDTVSLCVLSRHTWYIIPELLPLCLVSSKLSPQSKSATACALAYTHYELLPLGKPELPKLPVSGSDAQKMTLASLMSP